MPLRLQDLNDYELLHAIHDLAGDDYITSEQLYEGMHLNSGSSVYNVSARLSWMARYGTVERDYSEENRGWRLAPAALEILASGLAKRVSNALEGLNESEAFAAHHQVAMRALAADPVVANLLRRDMQYVLANRRAHLFARPKPKQRRRRR